MVWNPIYILLIVFSTLVDYYSGVKMGNLATKSQRKPYMALSLIANLSNLIVFKYFNFFTSSVNELMMAMGIDYMLPLLNLILPLGISFYTFQSISYTLDVYKGKCEPERRLGIFALYITFFPQLVAGPIERAKHLLDQFHFNYKFKWENIVSGLRLILLGLFKKVVLADQFSGMVSTVYNNPEDANGLSIYIASLFFAQQVYCDFSGYSDIARGSSRLLGIELMENFKLPFFSTSITSLWAKWHISLMSWFRDYIMFPLVRKKWSWPAVFGLIFLISGVWHGANWTFIVWGIYNGLFVIYSKATEQRRKAFFAKIGLADNNRLFQIFRMVVVFHIFAFAGIFFRSATLHDSFLFISKLFTGITSSISLVMHNENNIRQDILYLGKDSISFYILICFLFLLELFQWNLRHNSVDQLINSFNIPTRYTIYLFAVISIILMSNVAEVPFIYFQF